MSDQKIMACSFDAGPNGTLLSAAYGATMFMNELEILDSGFDGTVASVGHRAHFGTDSVGDLEDDLPRGAGNTFGQGSNTADQYAKVVIGTSALNAPGVLCRCNADGTGYMLLRHTATTVRRIGRWTSATGFTALATVSGLTALAPGDSMRIRASGFTITGDRNGVDEISTADASIAAGTGGVYCLGNTGAAVATSFEAGLLSSRLQSDPEHSDYNTQQIQRAKRRPLVVITNPR